MKVISDKIFWIEWLYKNNTKYTFGNLDDATQLKYIEIYKKYIDNSNWISNQKVYEKWYKILYKVKTV